MTRRSSSVSNDARQRVPQALSCGIRQQHHPIGVQLVAGTLDLLEHALDVQESQRHEESKPVEPLIHYGRDVFIEVPDNASRKGISSEPDAGVRSRPHAEMDSVAIHHVPRCCPRPTRHVHASGANSTLPQLARIKGWQNVLMMSILASPPNAPPTGVSIPNVFNTVMYPHRKAPRSSGTDRRSSKHVLFHAGPSPTEITQATCAPDAGTVAQRSRELPPDASWRSATAQPSLRQSPTWPGSRAPSTRASPPNRTSFRDCPRSG